MKRIHEAHILIQIGAVVAPVLALLSILMAQQVAGVHVRAALAAGMIVVSLIYFAVRLLSYRAKKIYEGARKRPFALGRESEQSFARFASGVMFLFFSCGAHYAVMAGINIGILATRLPPPEWALWLQALVVYMDAGFGIPVVLRGIRASREAAEGAARLSDIAVDAMTLQGAIDILFDELPSPMAMVEDGKFSRVNRKAAAALGYEKKDLIGRDYMSLIHPDDVQKTLDVVAQKNADPNPGHRYDGFQNRYLTGHHGYRMLEWEDFTLGYVMFTDVSDSALLVDERVRRVTAEASVDARNYAQEGLEKLRQALSADKLAVS